MATRSLPELESLARDPSWVPARKELPILLAGLAGLEAEVVERALFRAGPPAVALAVDALSAAPPALRVGLCRLLGRFPGEPAARTALLARLSDDDARTRRAAARGLGKTQDPSLEPALLAALDGATDDAERKVLVEALGKVGGAAARARLAALATGGDAVLRSRLLDADTRLRRHDLRGTESRVLADRPFGARRVRFSVRAGLESVLREEVIALGASDVTTARGVVLATLEGTLATLGTPRVALHAGFWFALGRGRDPAARVASVLGAPEVVRLLSTLTEGPVRYRLDWPTGHQRAATRKVVEAVAAVTDVLVNDPHASTWEVAVDDGTLDVWPKGLPDPRFTYRVADVPASSHPTIAAALARVAGVRDDDVVWDPFVGAGAELAERARLGPYRALFGSDLDPRALDAARQNLAHLSVELVQGDARRVRPPVRPSLVITNPPMGRRVKEAEGVTRLLSDVLSNVKQALVPGGRMVWLCPLFEDGARMARAFGFTVERRGPVDLGGFSAELQVLR